VNKVHSNIEYHQNLCQIRSYIDYREILKAAFIKKRETEPFYSLRDFAKNLKLAPSYVSYLFSGKRGLSKKNVVRVARAIELTPNEVERFRFLVASQSGRSKGERNSAKQGLMRKNFQRLR
jgi:uncharacterized protein (TIGR02147 family)